MTIDTGRADTEVRLALLGELSGIVDHERAPAVRPSRTPLAVEPSTSGVGAADGTRRLAAELLECLCDPTAPTTSCVLVGAEQDGVHLDRMARYLNASVRSQAVDVLCLPTSPLRAAVLVDLVLTALPEEQLASRDRLTAWLSVLERRSTSLVVARSALWLRGPWQQASSDHRPRLLRPRRGELLVVGDRGELRRVAAAGTPRPEAVTSWTTEDPVLAVVAADAARPDGTGADSTTRVVESFAPRCTQVVEQRRSWRRWWGRGRLGEVVLAPADVATLLPDVDELVTGAWRCSWCDKLHFEPTICSRCHADGRPPSR